MLERSFGILGLMILFGGRIALSVETNSGDRNAATLTIAENATVHRMESIDASIEKVLADIANRKFRQADDSDLIKLIRKGIVAAAGSKPSASVKAGATKAQAYVTDVTAAYTRSIFGAGSPDEALKILLRFQDTVRRIVDYAKTGDFAS